MKRVDALLAEYGSYHRVRGNLACHAIGIPLIVFGILCFLHAVRLPIRGWTAAEAVVAAAFVFYALLDLPLALVILVPLALLDLAARFPGSWKAGVVAFVTGWVFQGIGHARYEGNSPAFVRNLLHLMIGPLFLVNEIVRLRPHAAAALPARPAEK